MQLLPCIHAGSGAEGLPNPCYRIQGVSDLAEDSDPSKEDSPTSSSNVPQSTKNTFPNVTYAEDNLTTHDLVQDEVEQPVYDSTIQAFGKPQVMLPRLVLGSAYSYAIESCMIPSSTLCRFCPCHRPTQ